MEIWVRIRLRLSTVMRAIKALSIAADYEHHLRQRMPSGSEYHSEQANQYDEAKAEMQREVDRIEQGRDI